MRFVPIKSELAQSRLSVHAVRQGWVESRTQQATAQLERLMQIPGGCCC